MSMTTPSATNEKAHPDVFNVLLQVPGTATVLGRGAGNEHGASPFA
jgi:hypothetical protein